MYDGATRHTTIGRLEKLTFWGRAAAAWPRKAGECAGHFGYAAALRGLGFAFGLTFTAPSGVRNTPDTRPPEAGPSNLGPPHSRSFTACVPPVRKPAKIVALRDLSSGIGLTLSQRRGEACSDHATPLHHRFGKSVKPPRACPRTCLSPQSVARSPLRDLRMRRRLWNAVRSGVIDSHCASRPPSLATPVACAPRAVNVVG